MAQNASGLLTKVLDSTKDLLSDVKEVQSNTSKNVTAIGDDAVKQLRKQVKSVTDQVEKLAKLDGGKAKKKGAKKKK